MTAPSNPTPNDDETLAVPGVVCVTPMASGRKVIYAGPSAGWMIPRGIMGWAHELACVGRADAALLVSVLKATQPHEQIAPKKYPMAKRAADVSPLLPVSANLAIEARERGIRIHTIGVDRVSAGFYYFGEGGTQTPIRAQGNLIEMLAPSLGPSSTNAEIQALLDSLIDRLLRELSGGAVTELDVELANALPRFAKDGTGLEETDIEAFDKSARTLSLESAHLDSAARELVAALAEAARRGQATASPVALYGEARRESRAALRLKVGDKVLELPAETFWTVSGTPRENLVGASLTPPVPIVLTSPAPAVVRAKASEDPPRAATPAAVAERPAPKPVPAAEVQLTPTAPKVIAQSPRPAPVAPRPSGSAATPTTPVTAPVTTTVRSPAPMPAPAPAPAPIPAPAPAPATMPAPAVATATAAMPAATLAPATVTLPAPAMVVAAPTVTVPAPAPSATVAKAAPAVVAQEPSPPSERRSVPIPLVRPGRRAAPKPVEPAPGTSMVAVLLAFVAAAIGYFIYRAKHTGHF
jgi:hypothetical protein